MMSLLAVHGGAWLQTLRVIIAHYIEPHTNTKRWVKNFKHFQVPNVYIIIYF